jgi:hypothetical protein
MPERVEVVPDDLRMSADTVDAHADAVRTGHFEADGRIEAAHTGIPAASVGALSAAVTKWQADTTAMFGRMVDHADGMRSGAAAYTETDDASGQRISGVDLDL